MTTVSQTERRKVAARIIDRTMFDVGVEHNALVYSKPGYPSNASMKAAGAILKALDITFDERVDYEFRILAAEMEVVRIKREAGLSAGWRPEVFAFATLMEEQLQANDHKPGWKDASFLWLLMRLQDETHELHKALMLRMEGRPSEIGKEAADVANFAMMIADVSGAF